MIDKASAIPTIVTKLKRMPVGHGMDLRTYKRDRSIIILRSEEDLFSITENGFRQDTFQTDFRGLKKILKTLLRREFPRSNKIRVYEVTG